MIASRRNTATRGFLEALSATRVRPSKNLPPTRWRCCGHSVKAAAAHATHAVRLRQRSNRPAAFFNLQTFPRYYEVADAVRAFLGPRQESAHWNWKLSAQF